MLARWKRTIMFCASGFEPNFKAFNHSDNGIRPLSLWAAFFAVALLFPAGLFAATFTVTNTNDSGAGSLRQAIADANSSPGTDAINFNIPLNDIFRRSSAETSYTHLNPTLIPGLSFTDRRLMAAAGATYYYRVSAVDDSAQMSVLSAPAALTVADPPPGDDRGNAVSTRVSCFISSAYRDEGLHALGLLVLMGVFWLLAKGRRNKGASAGGGLEKHPPAADLRGGAERLEARPASGGLEDRT